MLEIDISTPKKPGHVLLIDECDAALVDGVKWSPDVRKNGRVYACRAPGKRKVYLHRLITGAPPGSLVDHIDRNGLNNTRENLRIVTPRVNVWNSPSTSSSGFKGVRRKRARWVASIKVEGHVYSLGAFDTVEAAALAYDAAALALGLDRTGLNFPAASTKPLSQMRQRRSTPCSRPNIRQNPGGTFTVRVLREGRRVSIGNFATQDEAVAAWGGAYPAPDDGARA